MFIVGPTGKQMLGILIRNQYKRSVVWVALSACIWTFTPNAHAIGLGRMVVNSALNQPLDAEISIASIESDVLKTLEVRLATDSDFRRANIAIEPDVRLLQFSLINGEAGPWIHVGTDAPIRSPFLHFLATIEWSGGKIIREYTALVSPPGYDSVAGQSIALSRTTGPREIHPGDTYQPVKSGETLMGIATRIDVDQNVTIYQRMFALMHINSEAFIRGNMNLLREGSSLTIPSADMMAGISRILAREEYTRQLSDWMGYQQGIEEGRARSGQRLWVSLERGKERMVVKGTENINIKEVSAKGGIVGEVESSKMLPTYVNVPDVNATGGYVLKIIQPIPDVQLEKGSKNKNPVKDPTDQSAIDSELEKVRNRLILAEESLVSKGLENEQLMRQIALLGKQIDKSAKIIVLQDEALALAQQQATLRTKNITAIDSNKDTNESATEATFEPSDSTVKISVLAKTQDLSTSEDKADQVGQAREGDNLIATSSESDTEATVESSEASEKPSVPTNRQESSTSEDKVDQVEPVADDGDLSSTRNKADAETAVKASDVAVTTSVLANTLELPTLEDKAELSEQELYISKNMQLYIVLGVAAISGFLIVLLIRRRRQQVFQSAANLKGDREWDTMTTTTQLDLARAYIEMGDNSAARNVLDEVIQRGRANQKAIARALVAKLQIENK